MRITEFLAWKVFLPSLTQFTAPPDSVFPKVGSLRKIYIYIYIEKYNNRLQKISSLYLPGKFRSRLFRCRSLLPNNGWGGGGLGRWPSSWTSWQRRRATTGHSKPAERGGVLGVALTVCVHIWINYGIHKLRVRPDQAVGYQFYFFSFLQLFWRK